MSQMPLERLWTWHTPTICRKFRQRLAVVRVVASTVLELITQLRGDPDAMLRSHCHIPAIEERVKLLGENDAVLDMIASRTEVWLNVGSIEHGGSVFPCDGALIAVGVE